VRLNTGPDQGISPFAAWTPYIVDSVLRIVSRSFVDT